MGVHAPTWARRLADLEPKHAALFGFHDLSGQFVVVHTGHGQGQSVRVRAAVEFLDHPGQASLGLDVGQVRLGEHARRDEVEGVTLAHFLEVAGLGRHLGMEVLGASREGRRRLLLHGGWSA